EPDKKRNGRKTWIGFVLGESRGPRNAISRLPTVINRFGFSPRKSLRNFDRLLEITDRYSVTPTLPVTAVTARRNPAVIRWLRDRGAEVAAHGYVHNDYAAISAAEQLDQVAMARVELSDLGFDVRGWRSPYSRWNADTVTALKANGFEYDASPVYAWPAFEQEQIEMDVDAQAAYQRVRALFNVRDASTNAVLPETVDGLVQIPMSIPQDEDMVDRLHLGPEEMSRVWLRVLADSKRHGEIFVVCLHPERAALCAEPLDAALFEAKRKGDVWIAPLSGVAEWWRMRAMAELKVTAEGAFGHWRVSSQAHDGVVTRFGGTERHGSAAWEIDSALKPVVYVGAEWPDATATRIREAGYAVEQNGRGPDGCAIVLSREFALDATPESIVRSLGNRDQELVRILPWPAGFASCMSITGDIDALTLFDFAMRLKEFS
ncbi:MAG TPA: polysaccharide deacetylase family protein, partial [Chloroflexota bacterium]|nr:polysaccharide deacetylase family protein [Chloroflexota bacterium]